MSQGHILLWSWKRSTPAAALPVGADFETFSSSLKMVEIPVSRGANAQRAETVAIAAGDSLSDMSLQSCPMLCRFDDGVYRSAVMKVRVDDIYDVASSVQPTTLQALLPVSGCRSFLEACISLAEFVKKVLPSTRALTAAVASLRASLAVLTTDVARGPGGLVPSLLSQRSGFLEEEGHGPASPLPDFARWMSSMVTERVNLSPGLTSPAMRSEAAVSVLIRDLHFRLSRHLLQPTRGGHFLAFLSAGGKSAQSDQLHVVGPYPEDLCTKAMLVVRRLDIRRDMLASELVSKCCVCVTSVIGGVQHARTVRMSPRGLFKDGDLVVAFLLQDVHEYLYTYNCLRRFSPCYAFESEDLQRLSLVSTHCVPACAQPSAGASRAFRAYMGLSAGGDSPGLAKIFGPAGRRTEFLDFARQLLFPEVLSREQEAFLQGFKKPITWLDGPPGSGKGVLMAICLTWCARQRDFSRNVFTVVCVDTRTLADDLFAIIGRYMSKGREKGIVHSACDFARLGRADDRDDWGGHWETFLDHEFQVRLADELSLLRQLDTRLQEVAALYTSSRDGWASWSSFAEWHVLRERFVREVVYPAEHRALVDIMAEVPGIVVTSSLLRKLLGGDSKEIPSQCERDFGSLQHWTRVMRSRRGSLLWVDEHQADSPQVLAPLFLHFEDVILSGGWTQTMNLFCDPISLEAPGNTSVSLGQSLVFAVSGSSECPIKTYCTDMLRYEMSSDWCGRNPLVEVFRLRYTHRYSASVCDLLAVALQRDYNSVASRESFLIPVWLGRLSDCVVNERDEVCFSAHLVAVLLRVLVNAFRHASSVLVVGFYADLVERVQHAVLALLPSALLDDLMATFVIADHLSFLTPKTARGREFDVAVILAVKKNADAPCWTGRHFLDPGCIEVALTRGILGTYVFMDEVYRPDFAMSSSSVVKKQMVWWNVRQHLWYRCEGLPEDVRWDQLWASRVVFREASPLVHPKTFPLAASFSCDIMRDLLSDDQVYGVRRNFDRQEWVAARPVQRRPADQRSCLLDAVFLRQEGASKFTVNVPTLCWYAWGRQRDPHHLAFDLWHRVWRLCSDVGVSCQFEVIWHKKALKFIGCYEVLEASAHSDRWGYQLTCSAVGDERDLFLYIYPCMGLVRQHASVTSVLAKSNSIFFVRKFCQVLSSQMGCKLDLRADPFGLLLEHDTSPRHAVTIASVRQALRF